MPKNRLFHVWVATGDSWLRQSVGNAKNKLLLVLGRDKEFLVAAEFFLVLCCGRNNCVVTWFQMLSKKNFCNMAFFVVTGVLVLCRDIGFLVMTETIMTRGQGYDKSLVKAKRFQVTTEKF